MLNYDKLYVVTAIDPVTVSLYKNILPGAQTKVLFTTWKQEKGMYVLREAVYQDGDDFYDDIYYAGILKDIEKMSDNTVVLSSYDNSGALKKEIAE